ncbi:MAG: hypothetical protein WBE90_04445 [Xanthobacteraceae bacterium]
MRRSWSQFLPWFGLPRAQTAGGDTANPAAPNVGAVNPAKPAPDATSPVSPGTNSTPSPGACPVPLNQAAYASPPKRRIRTSGTGRATRIFNCKPLACSDAETITILLAKSPTRHPDPQALDKFAKVDLPKSIRAADAAREVLSDGDAKVDTLTSKTTTLKTYPAVVNESRFTQAKAVVYINTALIFAGPVMIRIQSASQNRDLAQKTLNEFVDIMKIEEGPPLQPAAPESANPVPAISGKEEQL